MNEIEKADKWETGEYGASEQHAIAMPAEFDKEVDDAVGLQMISIRLPKQLLDDMKLIAKKEGVGYQPLIRRVLLRFAAAEFRAMAQDARSLTSAALDDDPLDTSERKCA